MSTWAAKVAALDDYHALLAHWRAQWIKQARKDQLPPKGDWEAWLLQCGRGFGKTRTGAEDAAFYAAFNPGVRVAVIAPTRHDCRSICFEGESGLEAVIPPGLVRKYNSGTLEIFLKNGSLIAGLSAEKPDRLRGPQWHRAWCDEVASWHRLEETWSNLDFSLRLGENPQVVVTTTPRPLKWLRTFAAKASTRVVRGSVYDNAANLAATAVARMKETYEGTTLGRQELHGEILEDAAGALWSAGAIDRARVKDAPALVRIVIAIDPAVTKSLGSDETGIVVAGICQEGHCYVLGDYSGRYSPEEWARLALMLYERHQADAIIAEKNNGGDLVESNIRVNARNQAFRYIGVTARRGKYLRAEPVSALYQQSRVHHVGMYRQLEDQMTTWAGNSTEDSPDRIDALVYAITELVLGMRRNEIW